MVNQQKFDFYPDIMGVFIGGLSSIDLQALEIKSLEEAAHFLLGYGFDPKISDDLRFIQAVYVEALDFIEKVLVSFEGKTGVRPPSEILQIVDPVRLIYQASRFSNASANVRAWSCAILRVMHTIAHIDGIQRQVDIPAAADQIEAKFRRAMFRDQSKTLFLGGRDGIELAKFDVKRSKSRQSTILKLLHKPANVAETIFDWIGVRIVTKKLIDVLPAISFLNKSYLVHFANTNPTRARNTLMDLQDALKIYDSVRSKSMLSELEEKKIDSDLRDLIAQSQLNSSNPHSSKRYQSIQLTCRQLVTVKDIGNSPHWARSIFGRRMTLGSRPGFKRIFFPFEIQIMDEASYRKSQAGSAAHDRYKRVQVRTARRRVLPDILFDSLESKV